MRLIHLAASMQMKDTVRLIRLAASLQNESHTVRLIHLAASLQMKVTLCDWSIQLQVCKWKSHYETDLFSCKDANESHTVRLIRLAASLQNKSHTVRLTDPFSCKSAKKKVTLWDWSISAIIYPHCKLGFTWNKSTLHNYACSTTMKNQNPLRDF